MAHTKVLLTKAEAKLYDALIDAKSDGAYGRAMLALDKFHATRKTAKTKREPK
jgi:hypothetical protein